MTLYVGQVYTFTVADYGTRENAYNHARRFATVWMLTVRNMRDASGDVIGYTVS